MINIQWRPYQIECKNSIKFNYDNGIKKQLITQATGTGKRFAAVNLMNHFNRSLFIAHREELIVQAYNEINTYFPMEVGIIKGPVFEIDKRIVVASVQTLRNRLERIPPDTFQFVAIDECFPAGTKIDGCNIENYTEGCIVSSFNHNTNKVEYKKIKRVIKRKYIGKLYDFGQFRCTPNHPIFIIGIGYCIAKEIYFAYICNKMMWYATQLQSDLYRMWEKVFRRDSSDFMFRVMQAYKAYKEVKSGSNILFELRDFNDAGKYGKPEEIHTLSFKRIWLLFRKMQKNVFLENCFRYYEQYEQEILFRKDEEKQSNVQRRIIKQNEDKTDWQNFSESWRKRTINKTANYIIGTDPIENRVSNISKESNVVGKESSKMLQGRSCLSGSKISNRDRWKNSSIEALEILRQTENKSVEKSRLDCIKIYKSTGRREFNEDCKENYVYNLEVEGNDNYFANSILVHNCHHYISKEWLRVARHFEPKLFTGWTATPKRLDGLSLSNLFEKIVFQYNISNGILDGFLAPLEAYQINTIADISRVKRTAGDFNQKQLSEVVDSQARNDLIVKKYVQYAGGRQGIAYCVDIDHAYNLRDRFREAGIKCETIVSDLDRCSNRSEIISMFKKDEIEVITNVEILTEGFDYNDVGCIMMGRPTQSETLYVQCIGRGTRLKSEDFKKKYSSDVCIILDFVDNTGKLTLVNAYELEKTVPIKDRLFLPKEHKEKLLEDERKRKERLVTLRAGKDNKINLFKLPEIKVWDSEKMLEPATDKQIDWLKRAGVWAPDAEYTKKQASEIISSLPCQEWQVRYLAVNNYDVANGATISQFQRVKSYIESKQKFAIK